MVTGASRGIGLEVCRQLAALGYVVVLGSRDLRAAELAAKELDPGGERVVAAHVEVDNSVNIEQLAEWIRERWGRVDAIVNTASTGPDQYAIAGTTDLSPVAEALDVNLFGAWRVIQALLPLLRSSPRPRVVNVSSEGGSIALMSGGRGSGRSVAQGAASVVWAVTLPNGGPTGTFTRDGRELPW